MFLLAAMIFGGSAHAGFHFGVDVSRQECLPAYKLQTNVLKQMTDEAMDQIDRQCNESMGAFFSLTSSSSSKATDQSCDLKEAMTIEVQGTCIIP